MYDFDWNPNYYQFLLFVATLDNERKKWWLSTVFNWELNQERGDKFQAIEKSAQPVSQSDSLCWKEAQWIFISFFLENIENSHWVESGTKLRFVHCKTNIYLFHFIPFYFSIYKKKFNISIYELVFFISKKSSRRIAHNITNCTNMMRHDMDFFDFFYSLACLFNWSSSFFMYFFLFGHTRCAMCVFVWNGQNKTFGEIV